VDRWRVFTTLEQKNAFRLEQMFFKAKYIKQTDYVNILSLKWLQVRCVLELNGDLFLFFCI